ncbi:MAG TPA: ATP-binding protein [Rhodanobacteraceae bacterium]|nr:ATP-binding protein [Rhodanobacteraceae bacterium]
MADTPERDPLSRLPSAKESAVRLAVLLAALVLIVGLAYLIRLRVTEGTINSFKWVSHTHEVKATVFELAAALNEMEAAAFAAQYDPLSESAAHRYGEARARYAPLLERLRDLTRDNPAQQERAGVLRAQIEGRIHEFDEALRQQARGRESAAGRGLATAVTRYPVNDVLAAIVKDEETLVEARDQEAERRQRVGGWVVAAVSLIQLALLAGIIWSSENQLRRRLAAEASARQAEQRAQLIVQTVREPIAVVSSSLDVVTCNQAFSDHYGLHRGDALGQNSAWGNPVLQQRLRDVVLTRREIWDSELEQSHGEQATRYVVANARPMVLPESRDAVILLTVSDVTARKQTEAQILDLNRQLEGKVAQISESNRELEAFSYSVSHDLRAPLRHIAGFAEKLRSHLGESADEETLHYSEVVIHSSRRMSSLIEDLLTYSRLGRHAMRLHGVDMQALVDEVRVALTSTGYDERRVNWNIAPLPVVVADENMIRLVWQNLIDNALKYTAVREEAVIEIGVDEPTPLEWVFRVRDNGIGFDMAYSQKLFGVFQRLHKASQFPGTGIGLASVRRIVGRLGGRTWAESAPDRGSTFFFSIPRAQNT